MIKQIFTWWNSQTFGTFIYTILFGKFVGKDEFGNKYYQKQKRVKDGSFIREKLMLQRLTQTGFPGFIIKQIKYHQKKKKTYSGKNPTKIIKQAQAKLINLMK